ncbi:hypothetical protein RMN56_29340 [Micromonospora halotolerans]|uniref:Uncharacterized protein n=1 Tax=Micromonospora halotolerans TaxID=709879 RepID=A0ABY9ZW96_9ACTN|nr:hypothetical protein [Micromonospora halotolerans]WNM39177.1 hypothetical protein RMN56_29340 [Micromonospora halotolerans]
MAATAAAPAAPPPPPPQFCLISIGVGLVTMPLTWIAYLILGPILAARAVEEHNARGW